MIDSTDRVDALSFLEPDLPQNAGADYSLAENASAPYFRRISRYGAYFLPNILLYRFDNCIRSLGMTPNGVVL